MMSCTDCGAEIEKTPESRKQISALDMWSWDRVTWVYSQDVHPSCTAVPCGLEIIIPAPKLSSVSL